MPRTSRNHKCYFCGKKKAVRFCDAEIGWHCLACCPSVKVWKDCRLKRRK